MGFSSVACYFRHTFHVRLGLMCVGPYRRLIVLCTNGPNHHICASSKFSSKAPNASQPCFGSLLRRSQNRVQPLEAASPCASRPKSTVETDLLQPWSPMQVSGMSSQRAVGTAHFRDVLQPSRSFARLLWAGCAKFWCRDDHKSRHE